MKDNIKYGKHISSDYNDILNIINSYDHSFNIVQFQVDSTISLDKYKIIAQKFKEKNIKVFIHSVYTINLANDWNENSWWTKYLINEIEIAGELDAIGVVFHTGKQLENHESIALNNLYSILIHIDKKTIKYNNVKLLIETAAGQGTELLHNLNKFTNFMKKFQYNSRFGIVIDTCHIFVAGNDLNKKNEFKKILKSFDEIGGKNKIILIHLNDSKVPVGDRKDRHESLGYGYIKRNSLIDIIKTCIKLKLPMILETPFENHEYELNWIKSLI